MDEIHSCVTTTTEPDPLSVAEYAYDAATRWLRVWVAIADQERENPSVYRRAMKSVTLWRDAKRKAAERLIEARNEARK